MKYIDTEKLIAEIKRRIESAAQKADISYSVDDVENEKKYDNERNVLERQLELVTSLQQEQPEVDLEDKEYLRKDLLLEWAKELTSVPYDRTTESALKHQIAHYILEKYNSL